MCLSMDLKTLVLSLAGIVAFSSWSVAQEASRRFPEVVLVQLRTEQNRVKALETAKKYKEVEEVKHDAAAANTAMKGDFAAHFKFCRYYFFADTNTALLQQHKLDGILTDKDGNAVNGADVKNYLVTWYGYPEAKGEENSGSSNNRNVKGLVIANDQLKQLSYVYKLDYETIFISKKKKYYYSSKHFDIEYFPLAEKLSRQLAENNQKGKPGK